MIAHSYLLYLLLSFAAIPSSDSYAFSQFIFSPNGVCIQPSYFMVTSDGDGDDKDNNNSLTTGVYFTMKNVPGDGDCMFLATALATATSMGLGANDVLLRKVAKETRNLVANILECRPHGTLLVSDKRLVTTQALLKSAAAELNLTTEKYLEMLRKEGTEGGLYGGGPELTVLSNVLRRPISVYELDENVPFADDDELSTTARIKCRGVFGSPLFKDPCYSIPESAILIQQQMLPGAYSWHLHLLVVQVSPTTKHACVLLPQGQRTKERS